MTKTLPVEASFLIIKANFLRSPRNQDWSTTNSWSRKKEKKAEGIWDLDPGAMEKAEPAFSGQRAQQAVNC